MSVTEGTVKYRPRGDAPRELVEILERVEAGTRIDDVTKYRGNDQAMESLGPLLVVLGAMLVPSVSTWIGAPAFVSVLAFVAVLVGGFAGLRFLHKRRVRYLLITPGFLAEVREDGVFWIPEQEIVAAHRTVPEFRAPYFKVVTTGDVAYTFEASRFRGNPTQWEETCSRTLTSLVDRAEAWRSSSGRAKTQPRSTPRVPSSADILRAEAARFRRVDSVQWQRTFTPDFYVSGVVRLPEEELLIDSLRSVPASRLATDDAHWNLALCLAYGSDRLGAAAAAAVYRVIRAGVRGGDVAGITEYLARTLLGLGMLHSGFDLDRGRLGVERLRSACPAEMKEEVEGVLDELMGVSTR